MRTRQSTHIRIEDPGGSESMPPRKMQKTAAISRKKTQGDKKGKGRAEFYYCLTQMPVDILLTICSELEPVDLLSLSRVSTGFHDFLWLKTNVHVWRLAYENLLPPQRPPRCPLDVSIIHYTNFIFGIHCQFCGSRGNTQSVNEFGLVRLCSKCVVAHTMVANVLDPGFRSLCHSDNGINILNVEYDLRQREMDQATKDGTLPEYLEQRRLATQNRSEHLETLSTWQYELAQLAAREAARIQSQRRNSILQRLSLEGSLQSLWWQLQYLDLPHTGEPHELTDNEWKYIRTDVIESIYDHVEKRQRDTIRTNLINCLQSLDGVVQQFVATRPRISPTALCLASWGPYRTLVMSDGLEVNRVLDHIALLPNHLIQWRQETDAYLAGLIPKYRHGDNPRPLLELAETFFRCFACTEPISYPRILMHSCFLRPSSARGSAKTQKKARKNIIRQPRRMNIINAGTVLPSLSDVFGEGMHSDRDDVSYYREASISARKIILACGEKPNTVTNTEMDQKDFRVECLLCSSTRRGRLVMRWTTAILHDLDKHGSETRAPWRLVNSAQDLEKVEQEEKKVAKKSIFPVQYFCRLCDLKMEGQFRITHLNDSHLWEGDEANALEQFYTDIDLTMILPPLSVKI